MSDGHQGRKRRHTATKMEKELNRQKNFKPREAQKFQNTNPMGRREQADESELINPTDDITELVKKLKLDREEHRKMRRETGAWLQKDIEMVGGCISCGKRTKNERCDECTRRTACGHQRTSREGKCEACAKERIRKWLDELPSEGNFLGV